MSNTQLYLAVGLPMLVTVLGFLTQNGKLAGMEKRLDLMDKRLDQIDGRLLAIETSMRYVYEKVGEHEGKLNLRK